MTHPDKDMPAELERHHVAKAVSSKSNRSGGGDKPTQWSAFLLLHLGQMIEQVP